MDLAAPRLSRDTVYDSPDISFVHDITLVKVESIEESIVSNITPMYLIYHQCKNVTASNECPLNVASE